MTQEIKPYTVRWRFYTDTGEHEITEKQMEDFIKAEQMGARFVFFDKHMYNMAFVKEAHLVEIPKPKAVWDEELGRPVTME